MTGDFASGDVVRVLRMPAEVAAGGAEETGLAFRLAVGKIYAVRRVNEIGWLEIDLGPEADRALGSFGNTIWIEPDCVEAAKGLGRQNSGPLEDGA